MCSDTLEPEVSGAYDPFPGMQAKIVDTGAASHRRPGGGGRTGD